MYKTVALLLFLVSCLTHFSFAASTTLLAENWVGTLSGGVGVAKGGGTQTLLLTPFIEKAYVANQKTSTFFEGELFYGLQERFGSTLYDQLGLALMMASGASIAGHIWDDADKAFDNYLYSYRLRHTHLGVKAKILADVEGYVMPWISGSVAIGINQSYGFSNVPIIREAVVTPNFANRRITAFSYTLGAGIQTALDCQWQLGLGYEFADWGKSQLGYARGQTLNRRLTHNHFYTQALLLSLTLLS